MPLGLFWQLTYLSRVRFKLVATVHTSQQVSPTELRRHAEPAAAPVHGAPECVHAITIVELRRHVIARAPNARVLTKHTRKFGNDESE